MASGRNPYDAVIIGGGPAGSQVAYRLAEAGYRVMVLERKENLAGPVCCTGIVSRRCVQAFAIPDHVIHREANGARLFAPGGTVLDVNREEPQVAILNRPAFNQAWANRAHAAGAEFLYATDVRRIETGKRLVTIESIRNWERLTLQARSVVVATGFGSQLADTLGMGASGDFVMGAQAEVATRGAEQVEVYAGSKIAPGFFAWLVPTSPGKALVGLLSRRHPPAYLRSLLTRLAAEGKIASASVPFTYGGVSLKTLPRTYGDRLLVVGTAAGQVKPITGGGIYFGLLCADAAATTLDRRLNEDDLSAVKLAAYERSWKRRLGRELRTGSVARRIFERLSDSQVDRIFALMVSSGLIEELRASPDLTFDSHADVVTRVFSQRLFAQALRTVQLPFHLRKGRRKTPRD